MRPDCITRISSALSSPTSRWVNINVVRPSIRWWMARSTSCSVKVSSVAVGSSRIMMGASLRRARDSKPLAFSTAQFETLLSDPCVIPLGQRLDHIVDGCLPRGFLDLCLACFWTSDEQVLTNRGVEQVRVLLHDTDQPVNVFLMVAAQFVPSKLNAALLIVPKT